jgi:hypothetical protein
MHYVILATHNAEVCPTANATVREMLLAMAPQIPDLAEKNGVTITAGPYANREHVIVLVADAQSADGLDQFLAQTRLDLFNSVRILPSLSMDEAMRELTEGTALF